MQRDLGRGGQWGMPPGSPPRTNEAMPVRALDWIKPGPSHKKTYHRQFRKYRNFGIYIGWRVVPGVTAEAIGDQAGAPQPPGFLSAGARAGVTRALRARGDRRFEAPRNDGC